MMCFDRGWFDLEIVERVIKSYRYTRYLKQDVITQQERWKMFKSHKPNNIDRLISIYLPKLT